MALGACAGGSLGTGPKQIALSEGAKVNIESLGEVISANSNDANALNLWGAAYGQAGRYRDALADFDKATTLVPKFFQAYNDRALIHVRLNQPDEALADYNQAIGIAPTYHHAYLGRGKLYRSTNKTALAIADFNKVIQLKSDEPIAYYDRGIVYQSLGQHKKADGDFSTAIGLRPNAVKPYLARGQSRYALDKYQEAATDFGVAVEQLKQDPDAWTWRGMALEKNGGSAKRRERLSLGDLCQAGPRSRGRWLKEARPVAEEWPIEGALTEAKLSPGRGCWPEVA